jgi:threonine dehydrogenase-like Zn-dependent dehydrogenase
MRAVTWHGQRDVRVDTADDPTIEEPTDAIVRITSSGLCGSDLHLYEVLAPFMTPGDVLGHEPMGIVEAIGSATGDLHVGDRVVVPFNISCGHCFMCGTGLQSQCETTQNRDQGKGASLFGYTKLYGQVPGGQAELLRVPQAQYGPITVPAGPSDDRFLYLSDVLPTAWQAVAYADVPDGGTVVVLGLGPIGDMSCRIAAHLGYRVIGIDVVDERLERVRARGIDVVDLRDAGDDDVVEAVRSMTGGRGPDSVIDAVGMEAHGSPAAKTAHALVSLLPDSIAEKLMERAGVDRLNAMHLAIDLVRRGGTVSLSGVYGGEADPMPMMTMFDKQITMRMGQANVKRWIDDLMPIVVDDADPLGLESFATHHVALEEAPDAYRTFQEKGDGMIKTVFRP